MSSTDQSSFIWLHIKKSAGQSIRRALGDAYVQTDRSVATPFIALDRSEWNDNLNNYRIPLGPYDYRRMLFAKRFLFPEQFDAMFKFCVVRNPYSRAVSSFLYEIRGDRSEKLRARLFPRRAFASYLSGLPEVWRKTKPRHRALHSAPVIPDICDDDGRLLVDFVGRLENLDADLATICDRIGIPFRGAQRVHTTRAKRPTSIFYDTRNRKLVERLYGEDIERLGYSFPEGK